MCRWRGNAGSGDDLNALRCALGIHSGKIILNSAMPDNLRAVRHCIFTEGGRRGKRHLQRRFLRKRSAAGKVCTGFQRAEPSQLRCAQHGTMRSISARNSRFFVSTCDNSSLSADRLIYLFISVLYHFCGYIAIVRYCLSLQFCLLPFR